MKYAVIIGFVMSILFIAFIPEQGEFAFIVAGFALAFISYVLLVKQRLFSLHLLLGLAFVVRLILLFAFPNLSDDIYRFVWDGHLLHLGESPFAFLPSEYIEREGISGHFNELYPKLNSPDYYSIYPSFAQLVFYIATFSWMNSSLIIKLLLLMAEGLTIFFGMKLLKMKGREQWNILWYALNPLIIIEIMGNIHFEGFMVCFFVLFLYYLQKKELNKAAMFIALSISAKLVPLLFLPHFLFKWSLRKSLLFFLKIGVILVLMFSPIFFQLSGFSDSLDLYFRKFEFNASFYYLLRALGEAWKGYNMIAKIGPGMALTVLILVTLLAYKVRDFLLFCQWALLVFLLLSTTVHPWYLSLGILISVFTGWRFFILWSFLIILSYSKYGLEEGWYYFFVAVEYISLCIFLLYELFTSPNRNLESV